MSRMYSYRSRMVCSHGHRWRVWTASLIQLWSRILESLSAWFVLGVVWFPKAETNSTTNDISYLSYLVKQSLARIYGGDHAILLSRIGCILVVLNVNYHSVTWPCWCRYDHMNVAIHKRRNRSCSAVWSVAMLHFMIEAGKYRYDTYIFVQEIFVLYCI
jgi:hypothetical protein